MYCSILSSIKLCVSSVYHGTRSRTPSRASRPDETILYAFFAWFFASEIRLLDKGSAGAYSIFHVYKGPSTYTCLGNNMNVGARTRRRRSHAYNIMYDKSPRSALVVVSYIYITIIYEFLVYMCVSGARNCGRAVEKRGARSMSHGANFVVERCVGVGLAWAMGLGFGFGFPEQ